MKNIMTSLLAFISLTSASFAGEQALHAHEHGSIKLGIAVEKNVVEFDIDGPTESFISFEYLPKTAKEKKIFEDAKNKWVKDFFTLVTFDTSLGCKISEATFNQVIDEKETKEAQAKIKDAKKMEEGVHSDIEAKAKITCKKDVVGTEVKIALRSKFKNIKKLTAEVISNETKSIEIKSPVQTIKL